MTRPCLPLLGTALALMLTLAVGLPAEAAGPSLAEIVEAAIDGQPGTWGVAVRDLKTGETVLINGDQYFPAASLYKLIVMYAVFRDEVPMTEVLVPEERHFVEATDEDPLHLGEPIDVATALEAMITVSSNAAAHLLAERVGWERLNEACEELGLPQTGLPVGARRTEFTDWRADLASTSPGDLLSFFTRLAEGRLIDSDRDAQMGEMLARQQVNDRFPAELPPEARVAHKTGNLPSVVNDAGIITGPGGEFVLVALASDTTEQVATQVQAQLARQLYDVIAAGWSSADPGGAWLSLIWPPSRPSLRLWPT
ncbi:MAG: serine hydrolase [Chloroflexi bacterium]|nr:serine hydrolase [Chloroflexota bacterium]